MSELTGRLELPVNLDAPAAARQAVTTALTAWGFPDGEWVDDAVLIADEMVVNAVRHGGGCLVLQIRADRDQVSIAVVDGSAVVPCRRAPDGDGGRGPGIIEALSQAWGVEDHHGGKRLWVAPAAATLALRLTSGAVGPRVGLDLLRQRRGRGDVRCERWHGCRRVGGGEQAEQPGGEELPAERGWDVDQAQVSAAHVQGQWQATRRWWRRGPGGPRW
ncbi:ATP-binding protein [Micromonospora sp. MS34]|uniref:ATP-binding protein n=1 Tax=Micromonospora sp. MS34 TaxID=3385971 RepID=UPI0039A07196